METLRKPTWSINTLGLKQAAYVCIVGVFFFVGVGLQQFLSESTTNIAVTMGVFIAGIALGIAPILRAAFIASVVRRTIGEDQ